MDKFVENAVDKFEDNCVVNSQNLEDQMPQWIANWANYIVQQNPMSEELQKNSLKIISEVLLASLQGDSCVKRQQYAIHDLGTLCLSEKQIDHSQVAPLVYDEEYLYLYRYWQLEQRLAQQVIRLTQQKLKAVDLTAYDDLLSDIHQKNALKM